MTAVLVNSQKTKSRDVPFVNGAVAVLQKNTCSHSDEKNPFLPCILRADIVLSVLIIPGYKAAVMVTLYHY